MIHLNDILSIKGKGAREVSRPGLLGCREHRSTLLGANQYTRSPSCIDEYSARLCRQRCISIPTHQAGHDELITMLWSEYYPVAQEKLFGIGCLSDAVKGVVNINRNWVDPFHIITS